MYIPSIIKWMLAFSPIGVVLVLMIGYRWGGSRAGAAGWFTALIVSIGIFGGHAKLLAFAQMKGVLLSLYVLYIVWMALFLYNVVQETGAIEVIGDGIQRLTGNKALQLLILGWVFASFLQGVAGFGYEKAFGVIAQTDPYKRPDIGNQGRGSRFCRRRRRCRCRCEDLRRSDRTSVRIA